MVALPDPRATLTGDDKELFDHMASARAHAEGRAQLGEVYVAMFNNAEVAARVGALGEHLRFNGVLPDEVRELVILRYAMREGFGYEWSHHQRPARLAGIDQTAIDELAGGGIPASLPDASKAALEAVDAVTSKRSIPADVQRRIVDEHGSAGAVEVVALCGLYAMMGYTVTAFDIDIEDGLPSPPF